MPDAAIFDGTRRHPGTKHGQRCAVKFGLRPSERCCARKMQGVRLREMALPEKQRGGVAPRRFKIRGFCRFPLPCFATGCHTDHFKIATSLRSSQ